MMHKEASESLEMTFFFRFCLFFFSLQFKAWSRLHETEVTPTLVCVEGMSTIEVLCAAIRNI